MKKNIFSNKQGSTAIFMVLIILSGVLLVGLGLGDLILANIKMGGVQTQSTKAYFAAEAGAEYALYRYKKDRGDIDFRKSSIKSVVDGSLSNDSSYDVDYENWQEGDYDLRRFLSIGSFNDVRRSVEITLGYYHCIQTCGDPVECCNEASAECGSVTDGCDVLFYCGNCVGDEYCDNNICTSVFPSGCTGEGDLRCGSEDVVEICEDSDGDGGLEWVQYTNCGFGWECSGGACQEACEDPDGLDINHEEATQTCKGDYCLKDKCDLDDPQQRKILEAYCNGSDEPDYISYDCVSGYVCDALTANCVLEP